MRQIVIGPGRSRFASIRRWCRHPLAGWVIGVAAAWQPADADLNLAIAGAVAPWVQAHSGTSPVRIETRAEWPNVELPVAPGALARLLPERVPTDARPSSRMTIRLEVQVAGRQVRSLLVPVNLAIWRAAWVARRDLAVGALEAGLQPALDGLPALVRAEVDVAAAAAWPWDGEPHGMRLRLPVLAGQAVESSHVVPVRAVSRGDVVVVRSRVGTVEIQAQARALRDADVGQDLPVRVDAATGSVLTQVVQAGVAEMKP